MTNDSASTASRFTFRAARITQRASRSWLARDAAVVLVILAVWLLFYWRLFTPIETDRVQFPSGDFTQQFLVFRSFALDELRQGRLPLWMPCVDSGYPYQADPQSAFFYPPAMLNVLLHLVSGAAQFSLSALELEAALHVLLAALLMAGFLQAEVRHRASALVGALAFGFGGYLTGYPLLQMAIVEAAAWLPLALWGARRLSMQAGPRSVALTAAPLALSVLAGHPQTYTFIFYTVTVYFLYRAWRARLAWRSAALRLIAVVGLAIVLSAVQLLPSFEYARLSTRAELSYVESGIGFPLADLIQFVLTGVVSQFNPLYVGLLPLALAGLALGAARNRDKVFWVVLGSAGLLLSFGSNLAVFDPVYWFAPGYRLFRDQERHALIVALAMSVLAAYGADALLHSMSRRMRAWLRGEMRWLAIGFVLLLIGLAVVSYLSWQGSSPGLPALPDRVALAVIALGASLGLLSLRSFRSARRRWLPVIMIAIVGFDLATANREVNWAAPHDPFPAQPAIAAIQADAPAAATFRIHNEQRLPGHLLCVHGLNEVGGITPIRLGHYNRFVKTVPREVRWPLLNVRYVVTWRSVLDDHLGQPVDAALLSQQGEGQAAIYVYRLNRDHPRAWVVHRVESRSDHAAIYAALAEPGFDPRQVAYTSAPVHVEPAAGADQVSFSALDPVYLGLDVDLSSSGLLVVSEVNYPGWEATVNGVAAPVVEVDGLLRGVELAAGPSRVEFTYRPRSLLLGGLLSGVGFVAWLILLSRKRTRDEG
ncbi:MAG: YfhO family protein [Anaerolineae bacterium]